MNKRAPRLCDEDRRAIDLLLNHGNTAQQHVVSAAAERVSQRRIAAAQGMMDLIGIMPAPQPPADLVKRTMERIARSTGKNARPETRTTSRPSAHLPHA